MDYLIHLLIFIAIFSILTIALNLVLGYTGLLSLAHTAFSGVGAYTTTILMTRYDFNFFFALLIGMILAGVLAAAIGLVLSKFKDDYYVLVSIGFAMIIHSIFLNWHKLTRGPLGIAGIDRPRLFGFEFNSNFNFLFLCLVLLMIVYAISHFIVNSSFGRVLKAIREDEKAIAVFGYSVEHYKLLIFVISAALGSITGALFGSYITFIDPSSFTLMEAVFVLSMVIVGGLANLKGAIWGTVVLVLLPELLRFVGFPDNIAAQLRQVAYGLVLILLMLYRPQGLMGEYKM